MAGPTLFDDHLRMRLADSVQRFERRAAEESEERPAAVVLAVVPDEHGHAAVLLTKRAKGLRRHSGQWALPGGRLDPGETVVDAALRELEEEVALRRAPEDILGPLDDYITRSGFVITPIVVWGGSADALVPDPVEVASIHRPTFDALAAEGAVHTHRLPWSKNPIFGLGILGTLVFAPTAAILHQFAELAVHGRTVRVGHYEQPRFAWR